MSDAPCAGQQTFALRLEYDGTDYCGSQLQANGPSIQGELERALAPLAGAARRVRLAGRTDAGVHAIGQVAALELSRRWTAAALQRALNARLPRDIAVTAAVVAPAGFDPRRTARSRRYRYMALNAAVRSPLLLRTAWQVKYALDDDAMRAAAAALEGEHDFAAFAGPPDKPGLSTVRRMTRADVRRRGRLVLFEFEANAFLPHQVRRMVGALIELGRGRLTAPQFARFLERPGPGAAGPAAPPQGLCLVGVAYDGIRFEVGEDG